MIAVTNTFTNDGLEPVPVRVEADIQRGLPSFQVIGLPDAAVRECRERVRAALVNSGFEFPLRRVIVNLTPGDSRKCEPAIDLAIAAAVLAADGQIDTEQLQSVVLVGELALDGTVRRIRNAVGMTRHARDTGKRSIVLPEFNGSEAAMINEIRIWAIRHVSQLRDIKRCHEPTPPKFEENYAEQSDLADLRGNEPARRAIEVAAAGGHSMLMVGPPGSGKTMVARRITSILPPLTTREAVEVVGIRSASGLSFENTVSRVRPFRAPHHTVSAAALIGSGTPTRPGEVTLAHHGVLYLDELVEFNRPSLEALRQPVAEHQVTVLRADRKVVFPANFQLLAGTNPCPCGHGPDSPHCRCSEASLLRFKEAVESVTDHLFDIRVTTELPSAKELAGEPGESSESVRKRVMAARGRQAYRYDYPRTNSEATAAEVFWFEATKDAGRLLEHHDRASGGRIMRLLKVARTIADLAGEDEIREQDMAEAIALTSPEALVTA